MDMKSGEYTQQPLLSIAIPTYNGSKTIRNMLNLLLEQYDSRIEIIISDNCSTDETPRIINEYLENFPFVRYIRQEHNGGADFNFLQCMKLASGKFTMLISDDDIIIENAIEKILCFLEKYPEISLAYLDALAFRDSYIDADHCHRYKKFLPIFKEDIVTTDKKVFMHYAQRLWGYTSNYIWSTERFRQIVNPEQYFGTYFLQSYINILCSNQKKDMLGLVKGPCIAIGEYGIIGNYDTALVEGIYYRRMIKFAVYVGGYDKRQFKKYYIWKICLLGRHALIKEAVAGVQKTKVRNLIKCTWNYPRAWITLYPVLLIPRFIFKPLLKVYRKSQGRTGITYVNRPT